MSQIIHIGANRSASTSLQKNLFNRLNNYIHFGLNSKLKKNYRYDFLSLNNKLEDFDFNNNLFKDLKKYKTLKKNIIFSSEDVCSSPIISECAFRLSKILPNAKILIIIRNQLDALVSWYNYSGYLFKFGPKSVYRKKVRFEDWLDYIYEFRSFNTTPLQSSPIKSSNYYKILSSFRKYFPKKAIHVLLYEDLLFNKYGFSLKLSKIMNVKKEIVDKYFIDSVHLNQSKSLCKNLIKKSNKIKLIKFYSNSNFKLIEDYNVDLKKYNYPL